jgi:methionine-rich copper-binding protein CopC
MVDMTPRRLISAGLLAAPFLALRWRAALAQQAATMPAAAPAAAEGVPADRHHHGVQTVESYPAAGAMVDGRAAEYFVRFDRPVDHGRSRLLIARDGRTVEELYPRLEAAPEVLFAQAPTLPPGGYELRWSVKALPDAEPTDGAVQFTMGR